LEAVVGSELQASLGYITRLCLKKKKEGEEVEEEKKDQRAHNVHTCLLSLAW
jgi:hypothetical protein